MLDLSQNNNLNNFDSLDVHNNSKSYIQNIENKKFFSLPDPNPLSHHRHILRKTQISRQIKNIVYPLNAPLMSPDLMYSKRNIDKFRNIKPPTPTIVVDSYNTTSEVYINNNKTKEISFFPKLNRKDYECIPSIHTLQKMSKYELENVENFTIIHREYGKVKWIGKTDISGLDLDQLIIFEKGSVDIYPNECPKHSFGEKLNKSVIITLNNCFPLNANESRLMKYEQKLKEMCIQTDTEFIEYNKLSGEWTFLCKKF